ncbi:MAG TPA: YrdB family protein [Ilumatobacter sp.]|nr:YrdB family protein [Ilumatobacter sp.]
MRTLGWAVLTFVFVDELACIAAFAVWGWTVGGPVRWLLAVAAPLVAMTVWYQFASPKAPRGGSWRRPLAKVVVFGLACLALWHAGHQGWAVVLLVFSAVINALAQLPSVRQLAADVG